MTVNIIGVKDTPINIDSNNNAKIDADELNELAGALGLSQEFLFGLLSDASFTAGETITLETLLDKVVSNVDPDDPAKVEKLLAKVKEIEAKLPGMESAVEAATKNVANKQAAFDAATGTAKGAAQKKLEEAEKELALAKKIATNLENEMNTAKEQLKQASKKDFMKGEAGLKDQIKQATGQAAVPKAGGSGNDTAPPYNKPPASNNGAGGGGAAADGKAAGKGDPYGGFGNAASKASYPDPTMANIGTGDGFINDSWDAINESQKRQKMLMLFFYYAKMAMSGDIGAMYQFMRFITQVIARDKALQMNWCSTKLLELQALSKKNIEDLTKTDADDTDGKWTKKLYEIKGDEGMIATSQKLITQMMEEFTQIVEALTNVQKSLLDVNGKVQSNLSQWR